MEFQAKLKCCVDDYLCSLRGPWRVAELCAQVPAGLHGDDGLVFVQGGARTGQLPELYSVVLVRDLPTENHGSKCARGFLNVMPLCKSCRISQNTPPDQSSETLSWLRCGSPSSPSTIRSTEAQFVHIRNAIADNLNNSPTKAGHHQDAGLEAGCFANAA